MADPAPAPDEVLVTRDSSVVTLTFKEAVRRIQADRRASGGEDLIALTYASADFKEGVRAFLEKRRPSWSGT